MRHLSWGWGEKQGTAFQTEGIAPAKVRGLRTETNDSSEPLKKKKQKQTNKNFACFLWKTIWFGQEKVSDRSLGDLLGRFVASLLT
jgi:hypothetical protein